MWNPWKRNHKLKRWVDGYIEDRAKRYPIASAQHADWLVLFMEVCDKEISDIDAADVGAFVRYVDERYNGLYARMAAVRAVSCFLRYYRARGHKYLPAIHSMKLRSGIQ